MGVYARGQKLWLRLKDASGKWVDRSTVYRVGEEDKARRLFEQITREVAAGKEVAGTGPVTVKAWGEEWLKRRREDVDDHEHDETRLKLHLYPTLGSLRLREVRPRHILAVVRGLRKTHAPRTVRNVYSVARALFRDAAIEDLIEHSPCILGRSHLPAVEDSKPEWRATAIYAVGELETLVSSTAILEDRRLVYALLGLGMLRHGEMAGLRWRHYLPELKPLGRLVIATSYDKGATKTGRERWMPVHPALAALLAGWRLGGWARTFGRAPGPDDLVLPRLLGPRRGTLRSKEHSHYLAKQDFAGAAIERRRLHDLRRTGISLAREAGAVPDVLALCTHGRPRDVMSLYTTLGWAKLCAQVAPISLHSLQSTTKTARQGRTASGERRRGNR